jgi:hypothetical protein
MVVMRGVKKTSKTSTPTAAAGRRKITKENQ